MANIFIIHGDESQLIEDKKKSLLAEFATLRVESFSAEAGAERIHEALCEDSLFGEAKLLLLVDIPVLKTTEKRTGRDRNGSEKDWQSIYANLMDYNETNPIIMIYHGNLDRRLKINKEFLAKVKEFHFHKLSKEELIRWSETYCRSQGISFSSDGKRYFLSLMELWEDVPLTFLKTEFDRLFLFLPEGGTITAKLLASEGSDFGSKNIFKFTDAFFAKDVRTLRELMPFVLQTNEVERFFAYFEGQLRLQVMVNECRKGGMSERMVYDHLVTLGMSIKSYPVKLAYERASKVSAKRLQTFLKSMYQLVLASRQSQGKMDSFRELSYVYCSSKDI